jgi:ATP-grasp domain-containing protein
MEESGIIMQWLIQCTDLPDTHTGKLLEEVKKRNLPFVGIGVRPFTHDIIDLEKSDPKAPSMFYGSTQLIQMISSWQDFRPGAYYQKEWFDPREWIKKRSDMLNQEIQEITVKELRSNWVDEPMFIKSVEPKWLTGMVIEPIKEDHDNWMIEQSELDGDAILVMSYAQNIELECRFFVVDGKVITGSTYRWLGARTIRRPVDDTMHRFAQEVIKGWMPNPNIVIDLCQLRNGEQKIVELNSLNSSGFYSANVGAIVDAIEAGI